MTDHPTDSELKALRLVLGRQFSVERAPGRVLVTLRRDEPLVTWSLSPVADGVLGGPRLTEWVEYLGGTAASAFRGIAEDEAGEPAERIERIVRVTEQSAQAYGDDFRVAVDTIHTEDPDAWFD
ncbi:MAG TPA: hypothetical protein VMA77_06055 [Solirubrobacteraceae bacterium]|nr:hypothetical protein [Solirubrobacteraceae bacterium]